MKRNNKIKILIKKADACQVHKTLRGEFVLQYHVQRALGKIRPHVTFLLPVSRNNKKERDTDR